MNNFNEFYKNVYSSKYVVSWKKYADGPLPDKSQFHSILKAAGVCDEDYQHV